MLGILDRYDAISLEEMKCVRLMNRIDTKFVTTFQSLVKLLELAEREYCVQKIDGEYNMPYYTRYFDTEQCDMYIEHLRGRKRRQKIRIRQYETSGVAFLEIKNKNNKGRTAKRRIAYDADDVNVSSDFINTHSLYSYDELSSRIENRFSRITLVNRNKTERLTIDTGLKFHNFHTGNICELKDLVIIELKRDGNVFSPISEIMRQLRIHPAKFSKYCMGMAFTDEALRKNRFKPRMRMVEKMCQITENDKF